MGWLLAVGVVLVFSADAFKLLMLLKYESTWS
jgi:hypothetical protein